MRERFLKTRLLAGAVEIARQRKSKNTPDEITGSDKLRALKRINASRPIEHFAPYDAVLSLYEALRATLPDEPTFTPAGPHTRINARKTQGPVIPAVLLTEERVMRTGDDRVTVLPTTQFAIGADGSFSEHVIIFNPECEQYQPVLLTDHSPQKPEITPNTTRAIERLQDVAAHILLDAK